MTAYDKNLRELERVLTEWTKTPHGRRAFLAAVPLLLTACASKKTRYREGDNSGQVAALTPAQERQMAAEYLPQMQKEYPEINNPELQRYINSLGQSIVHANGLHGKPYTYNFSVVHANFINAFALPAGTVMVTAPLLAMAETEAELAGVVGHEIGHVKSRHTAERIYKAKAEQSNSILWGVGGGLLGSAAGFGLGKLLCRKNDRACLTKATAYGALAGAGGGLLIQKFAFMANSREDEMEADRIGFKTAVATNFHKDYVGNFYEKLLTLEKKAQQNQNSISKAFADAMSTHPPSEERVAQMNQMASVTPVSSNMQVTSDKFEQMRILAKRYSKV